MRIGFDLDEVLCNITGFLLDSVNKEFGLNLDINAFQDYNFHKNNYTDSAKINKEIADRFVELVIDGDKLYKHSIPYTDMVNAVNILNKEGHEIHIVTARGEAVYDLTSKWLAKENISYTSLSLVGLNACKQNKIKDLCLDYFIDDHIDNIIAALTADEELHGSTFLVDKPWNVWYNDERVIRVYKSENILEHINGKKINKYSEKTRS